MKKTLFWGMCLCAAAIALTSCKSEQNEPIQEPATQLTSREILEANVPKECMEIGNSMVDFVNEFMSDFSQNVKNPNCDDEVLAFAKERYQAYNSASSSLRKAPGLEEPYEFSQEELEILGKINKMVLMSENMTLTAAQTQEIINDIKKLPVAKQGVLNKYMVITDEIPTIVQGRWIFRNDQYYLCQVGAGMAGAVVGAAIGSVAGPAGSLIGFLVNFGTGLAMGEATSQTLQCSQYFEPQGMTDCTIWVPISTETDDVVIPTIIDNNAKIDLSDNKVWAEPNTTLAGRGIKDSDFINGSPAEIEVFKKRLQSGNELNETRRMLLE